MAGEIFSNNHAFTKLLQICQEMTYGWTRIEPEAILIYMSVLTTNSCSYLFIIGK